MARSQTFHDTNGVDQEWEVSFTGGYLSRDHVTAYFYPTGVLSDPRQAVSFTWITDNLIRITPALADGGKLLIQRATPIDQSVVRFTDIATLTKQDLQSAADQAVLAVAELVDQYEDPDLLNALADARTAADEAVVAGEAAQNSADLADDARVAAQGAQVIAQSALNLAGLARDGAVLAKGEAELARDAAEAAQLAAETSNANNAKTNLANVFTTQQQVTQVATATVDYANQAHVQGIPNLAWVESRVGKRLSAASAIRAPGLLASCGNADFIRLTVSVTRASSTDAFPVPVLGPVTAGPSSPDPGNGIATITRHTASSVAAVGMPTGANTGLSGVYRWASTGAAPSAGVITQTYHFLVTLHRHASGLIASWRMNVRVVNSEFVDVYDIASTGVRADDTTQAPTLLLVGLGYTGTAPANPTITWVST